MVMHREYLKALKVIKSYEEQMEKSSVKVSDLSINQKVKRNYPESWFYWVSEIVGEDVLLRTTEKEEDPECDDFMVNVSEIRLDLS